MAQAKALDALTPFVVLAQSANSPRYAADLVVRATSHPGTFVFAELLQTASIQALAQAEPEYAAHLILLQIFSYGTYADYERGTAPSVPPADPAQQHAPSQPPAAAAAATAPPPKSPLPPLNDAQATKLRQLSLVSLATDRASLGYDHLLRALGLADARQLESLVISAVYAGLVAATLDPAHQVVRVSSVAPLRDLPPGAVPRLHAALQAWSQRCEAALAALDAQIADIRRAAASRTQEAQRWDAQFKHAVEAEKQALLKQDATAGDKDGGGMPGALGKRPMTLNVSGSAAAHAAAGLFRLNKRGSNQMAGAGGASGAAYSPALAGGAGAAAGESAGDIDDNSAGNTNSGKNDGDGDDDDDDEEDDDEAMDVDDDEGGGASHKRNRRKA